MKLTGPYLTLAGGLTVAGVLLTLSTNAVQHNNTTTASAATVGAQDTSAKASTKKPAGKETSEGKKTSEDKVAPAGTYAGTVKGGKTSVAIAIKGRTAIAYVCDGKEVEAWMQGKSDAAPLSLTGSPNASLKAKYAEGWLSGSVKAGGKSWTFKIKTVKSPSGLYRSTRNVRTAKVVSGWIIYNGSQVGMTDSGTGVETPAPPIDLTTGTATIDGVTVHAEAVDGSPLD